MKVPIEWIKTWVTKRGRRIPILDPEAARVMRFYKKSPIPLASLKTVDRKLGSILDMNLGKPLNLPSIPVVKELVQRQRVVDKLLQRNSLFKDFLEKHRFFIFDGASNSLSGMYTSAATLRTVGALEVQLTRDLKAFLPSDIRQFYFQMFSSYQRVSPGRPLMSSLEIQKAFSSFSGLIGVSSSLPENRIGTVFSHEVGHGLEYRLFKTLGAQKDFNQAYAAYLEHTMPQFRTSLEKQISTGKSTLLAKAAVLKDASFKLTESPEKVPWLSNYSLVSPWEGFSEGFAFYTGTSKQRELLKMKWPEGKKYFDRLFGGK